MNTKSRITYRFDNSTPALKNDLQSGPQPKQIEKPKVVPIRQEDSFLTSIPPWNSPFQDDPTALEKLIRGENPESHAEETLEASNSELPFMAMEPAVIAKEKQTLRWSLPPLPVSGPAGNDLLLTPELEPELPNEFEQISGRYIEERNLRPSRGPSWLKVLASVSGAVVTGALFGYLVLSLFANQSTISGNTGTSKDETALPVQSGETSGTTAAAANQPQTSSGMVQVTIPVRSYYLLQYGMFSGKEGMDAAVEQLKSRGFAAVSDESDGYRVYAGMAKDKNGAQTLGGELGDLEVFDKMIKLPASSALHFSGDVKAAQSFFDSSDQLIMLLEEMTVAKLGSGSPSRFTKDQTEAWKNVHQSWTRAAADLKSGLGKEDTPAADRMIKALNTAAISLDEYEKKPSMSYLWSAQSALTEAVLTQKQWL